MSRYRFTAEDRRKARRAQAKAAVPAACPHCGCPLDGYDFNRYLGHLGLHGLADNHSNGDLVAAQRRLRQNGLAGQDPAPVKSQRPHQNGSPN